MRWRPSGSTRRSCGVLARPLYGVGEPPRSMRWCQRRLRPGRLGPGSGRLPSRCAPSSGGGRDLLCVDPLRWVESTRGVADEAARGSIAVTSRPSRADLRDFVGVALNKCISPDRTGNGWSSPDETRGSSCGTGILGTALRAVSGKAPLAPRGTSAARVRSFSFCRVSCPPVGRPPSLEGRAQPRHGGRAAAYGGTVL